MGSKVIFLRVSPDTRPKAWIKAFDCMAVREHDGVRDVFVDSRLLGGGSILCALIDGAVRVMRDKSKAVYLSLNWAIESFCDNGEKKAAAVAVRERVLKEFDRLTAEEAA